MSDLQEPAECVFCGFIFCFHCPDAQAVLGCVTAAPTAWTGGCTLTLRSSKISSLYPQNSELDARESLPYMEMSCMQAVK